MVGKVTSEGDRALRSNVARQQFNLDGSGITIGVISDSFNAYQGEQADINSGDLPGRSNLNGYDRPVRVLKDQTNFRFVSDEGRAMLQIIHDVAPGARLLFHSSGKTETEFAMAVKALERAGADIIVDDIGFSTSGLFQDGVAAQAVTAAVDAGIVYFSAAGNDGDRSYESVFRPGTTFSYRGSTYQAQDFDPGNEVDVFQTIQIPRKGAINLILNWDQPTGQVANDVELFLLENPLLPGAGGQGVRDASVVMTGLDDPAKQLIYQPRSAQTVYLVIARKVDPGVPAPELIKWVSFAEKGEVKYEYVNEGVGAAGSSTIFGQPNAKGAIAVGAVDFIQTPAFGVNPPVLETFSSQGKIPILFDINGNRLPVSETRLNAEIAAPDGVSTTVDDPFTRGVDFSPFFGTSAAAPHAAAVAALMLQRAGGRKSLTPAQVLATLQSTAIASRSPQGFAASGNGFIQADAAVLQSVSSQIMGTLGDDTLRGTGAADNLIGLAGDDQLIGAGGFDWAIGGAGQDILDGNGGNDYLLGNGGHDQVKGGRGNDVLNGGGGQDTLLGGDGEDWLVGGNGKDTLNGGKGENKLVGGKGRDRFELQRGGMAIVADFRPGEDQLILPQGLAFSTIDIIRQGQNSLIQTSGQVFAKLNHVQALQASDFLTR